MKRILQLIAIIGVFGALMLFNRYAADLGASAQVSVTNYFVQRAVMALWLALAGFLVELPRIFDSFSEPGTRLHIDIPVLVIYGLPSLFLALLPVVVATFRIPMPYWLVLPNALPAEVVGGFLFGIAVGKAITREEYRVF
ncbi:MAG: hypothetical protein H0Z35_09640 [Thermoanaerobacteraceae bacterium]|nr:hypothetical protein [Thermoanaerobacteraceae bacterium]